MGTTPFPGLVPLCEKGPLVLSVVLLKGSCPVRLPPLSYSFPPFVLLFVVVVPYLPSQGLVDHDYPSFLSPHPSVRPPVPPGLQPETVLLQSTVTTYPPYCFHQELFYLDHLLSLPPTFVPRPSRNPTGTTRDSILRLSSLSTLSPECHPLNQSVST